MAIALSSVVVAQFQMRTRTRAAGVGAAPTDRPYRSRPRGTVWTDITPDRLEDAMTFPESVPRSAPESHPEADPVAAHLTALEGIEERPLAQHADIYQQVHAGLQQALAEIDGA